MMTPEPDSSTDRVLPPAVLPPDLVASTYTTVGETIRATDSNRSAILRRSLLELDELGWDNVAWAAAGDCQCGPRTTAADPPQNAQTPTNRIVPKRFMMIP